MIGIDNDIEDLAVLFFPVKVKYVMCRDNRGRDQRLLQAGTQRRTEEKLFFIGLNPTSVLPGAISLAETVSVKDSWQFVFIFRSNSPIHGPTPASAIVGVKSMARELFYFSYLRAPDSLLPLVT